MEFEARTDSTTVKPLLHQSLVTQASYSVPEALGPHLQLPPGGGVKIK